MLQRYRYGFRQMTYGIGMDESEPMAYIESGHRADDAESELPTPKPGNYWQHISTSRATGRTDE
jgi:hypothetical protein